MSALAASLLVRLGIATLVFTLLAGLLLGLRQALRARAGAAAVYALWLALPIGLAPCCWPRHAAAVPVAAPLPRGAIDAGLALVTRAHEAAGPDLALPACGVWLAGVAGCAAVQLLRQRALLRGLGRLRPGPHGAWLSARQDAGPLLVGLAAPRIVLPADFFERYDTAEQAAVLAHERVHARRGDLWWNALAALLACLFWFHPLAGAARRRFLADQELACDSAVLGSRLCAPRVYANALLKTLTTASLPVGCTMQAIAPIKERLMHLEDHVSPRRARFAVGAALAAFSLAGAGFAWAATGQAPATGSGQYRLTLDLSVDGGAPRHEEVLTAGSHRLGGLRDGEGRDCEAELALTASAGATVGVAVNLVCDGKPAAAPRLLARLGEPVTLAIGRTEKQADGSYLTAPGFRLSMKVDQA